MLAQGFTVCYSPLSLLKLKEQGVITRFKSEDKKVIDKLLEMGIKLGQAITLEQKHPSFVIKIDQNNLVIDSEIASLINVRVTSH